MRLELPLGDPGRLLGDDDRRRPGGHWVMGMNWFHRLERRYIEYGSSFEATRTFGLFRAMYDLVYNMNLDHLSWEAQTIFERLGDAGVRTATHPVPDLPGAPPPPARPRGPREARRRARSTSATRSGAPTSSSTATSTPAASPAASPTSAGPGTRDEYSACVGEELVREGAYDFLLFSLPDNDFHSHRHGPERAGRRRSPRPTSASRGWSRPAAASTPSSTEHAVILTADHAQTAVEHAPAAGRRARPRTGRCCSRTPTGPRRPRSRSARPRAPAPSTSSTRDRATPPPTSASASACAGIDGVDLIAWLAGPGRRAARARRRRPAAAPTRSRPWSSATATSCASGPAGSSRDRARQPAGRSAASPRRSTADVTRGRFETRRVPGRPRAALVGAHLAPRRRRPDLGRGRLRVRRLGRGQPRRRRQPRRAQPRATRSAPLLFVGCGPKQPQRSEQWALRDLAPVILEHFGVRRRSGRERR